MAGIEPQWWYDQLAAKETAKHPNHETVDAILTAAVLCQVCFPAPLKCCHECGADQPEVIYAASV